MLKPEITAENNLKRLDTAGWIFGEYSQIHTHQNKEGLCSIISSNPVLGGKCWLTESFCNVVSAGCIVLLQSSSVNWGGF